MGFYMVRSLMTQWANKRVEEIMASRVRGTDKEHFHFKCPRKLMIPECWCDGKICMNWVKADNDGIEGYCSEFPVPHAKQIQNIITT